MIDRKLGDSEMKRFNWIFGILAAVSVATAVAQPPGGPGRPPGGPGGGPPGGRPSMPIIEVLDADHDHVISANELKNATASLLTLDKNNDGKLTENEFAPQPGGPAGRGQAGGRAAGGNGRRPQQGGQGGGPDGGPPAPNSERMFEHAMEFDANKDGKLSKTELRKFVEDFEKHHAGPGGPEGERPDGPGNGSPDDGAKPERPKRPE